MCSRECGNLSRIKPGLRLHKAPLYDELRENKNGEIRRVLLHRYLWEKYHKKKIPEGYFVHHINHNTKDNSYENLELMEAGEHTRHHRLKYKTREERLLARAIRERGGYSTYRKPPIP